MKKLFTSFLLGAMLLISGTARAQFYGEISADPTDSWCTGPTITFPLDEVAKAMGVSAGQLIDTFEDWSEAAGGNTNGYPFPGLLWLPESSPAPTFHSEQYGGFEMDKDGNFASWNGGSYWGIYISHMDIETNELGFIVCQNASNSARVGATCHGVISLSLESYAGIPGTATFDITFTINKPEGIDKEPVTDLTKLTIVSEINWDMEQEPKEASDEWASINYWIPAGDFAELLGIDPQYMHDHLKDMLFVKTYDSEKQDWGPLTNDGGAVPSPGFYFCGGCMFENPDDPEGELIESMECRNGVFRDNNIFWVCYLDYQVEYGNLFCQVGQTLGAINNGQTRTGDIYIIYGDKAILIHMNLTVGVPPQTTPEDLTKVGEMTWTIENRDPRKIWNELEYTTLDLDELAKLFSEAMGKEIDKADITFMGLNKYNGLTDEYTADNDVNEDTGEAVTGFWVSPTGVVGGYSEGTTAFYVDYFSNGTLGLGNKPNFFDGGENASAKFYLVVEGTHYYEINLVMSVMLPPYTLATIDECEEIPYNLTVQLIPSANDWQVGKTSAAAIEELAGANDLAFIGVNADGAKTVSYSVSEASTYGGGGFWMSPADENGYAYSAGYTGSGAFAIWYYNGEFNWFNQPGLPQVGTETTAVFYMANFWDGKVVKVNVTIKWVDKIIEIKPIGTEEVVVNARNASGDDYDEIALDLTKCLEALNCSEEEFLESGEWKVLGQDGILTSEGFIDMYGFTFNAKGQSVEETAEDAEFQLGFIDGTLHSFVIDEANIAKHYEATLYAVYNEKLYAFNVVINPIDDAIANVATDNKSAAIYDLAGRRVNNPTRGIYISAGKKFMVK